VPDITSESETDFHDLVFRIQRVGKLLSGAQILRVAGRYHGELVGLDVFLEPAWKEGQIDANVPITIYRGTVALRSAGEGSDRLLGAMDELYATAQHPRKMRTQTSFAAISLEGDPRDLKAGSTKLKLFFESDDETHYAELYLNIDWKTAKVHLDEKDPDYRAAIVRALSAQ